MSINKSNSVVPRIVPRQEHAISRKLFSRNALVVLNRLQKHGFQAYMVGGGVRDLLLGATPKDFDLVTNARPEQIKEIFSNCRLIGRRFRLAHIHFGYDIIEVATFRGCNNSDGDTLRHSEKGMIVNDNQYGRIEDDVWRRDFTINALYYNIADFSLVDYTDGLQDLQERRLKLIGEPEQRYIEDPVRMLRAVRLAIKLGLHIDENTAAPIKKLSSLLTDISNARLFEELQKLFLAGYAHKTFQALQQYSLLQYLIPQTLNACEGLAHAEQLIQLALINTDKRIHEGKPINPAFLLAVFLWPPYQLALQVEQQDKPVNEAQALAFHRIHKQQIQSVAIPRRFLEMIRQIWDLQTPLIRLHPKKIHRLLEHKRFRAAYDFLLLRVAAGENQYQHASQWWTDYQEGDGNKKKKLLEHLQHKKHR